MAVIVILAVVALVATPIIITSVSKAKESAASSSAIGYIDGVNKSIELQALETEGLENGFYTIEELETLKTEGKLSDDIKIQGNTPTSGWVLVQGNSATQYSLIIDGYRVSEIRNINETTTTKTVVKVDDNTELLDQPNFYISNPSVVYLDPTDLSKTCTESDSVSTTETKYGCMKWYVYYNDGNDAKLLLDHNTTARLAFSSSEIDITTMQSEISQALNNDVLAWSDNIKKKEIITKLDIDNLFDLTGKINGDRAWLYNYTYGCTDYYCEINDDNSYSSGKIYGYWIKSDDLNIYDMHRNGKLNKTDATNFGCGIRPVITISSSLIN